MNRIKRCILCKTTVVISHNEEWLCFSKDSGLTTMEDFSPSKVSFKEFSITLNLFKKNKSIVTGIDLNFSSRKESHLKNLFIDSLKKK